MKNFETYSPLFLENLRLTGNVQSACQLSDINWLVYHGWISSQPSFANQVNEAVSYHRENRQDILRLQAEKVLVDYLTGTVTEITRTITTVRDSKGDIVSEIESEKRKTIPPTIKELFLILHGSATEEGKAVNLLSRAGVLPDGLRSRILNRLTDAHQDVLQEFLNQYPETSVDEKLPGITDSTADQIRTKILGISKNEKMIEQVVEVRSEIVE